MLSRVDRGELSATAATNNDSGDCEFHGTQAVNIVDVISNARTDADAHVMTSFGRNRRQSTILLGESGGVYEIGTRR